MLNTSRGAALGAGFLLAFSLIAPADAGGGPHEVTFARDVMAVLAKGGCNAGVCHGNKNGKGGFKLSLFGQDPDTDLQTLRSDVFGRRVSRVDPGRSLVLLKPTGSVPHEGGRRFGVDSLEYGIVREWISRGCPEDRDDLPGLERLELNLREKILVEPESEVALRVHARFGDGSRRDVTSLAVYDPVEKIVVVSHDGVARFERSGEATVIVRYLDRQVPVRLTRIPARAEFAWPADATPRNFIDELVFAKLNRLRIRPSELCSNSEFVRRAFIDALGILPTAEEARAFVSASAGDERNREQRRDRLIDELLERPEFAEHWALKWSDLLRIEEKTLDRKGVQAFHGWIRRSIDRGMPLNEFARQVLASRGSTYSRPASNFYRASRDPISRAESTAQLFLGVRLRCAKCHNHPFDRWTQDDYYSWANVFARVRYKILENRRRDRNDKHEFKGEQIVWIDRRGDVDDPRSGQPRSPRFLGESTPADGDERLLALAEWVADRENPFFARAQVNRIWYHLMGRGIVNPIDDFRATNPPSHPELLERLTRAMVDGGFDLRGIVRLIMRSRTYQLSSRCNETNADDEINYARRVPRQLGAEQLLDAIGQAVGTRARFNGYPEGLRAGQIPGVTAIRARDRAPTSGSQFLRVFGKPPRLLTCECERSTDTTMSQAFQLISGRAVHRLLSSDENRLGALVSSGASAQSMVRELYWAALARAPKSGELSALAAHIEDAADRRQALEDVAWGLINSKEFLFR